MHLSKKEFKETQVKIMNLPGEPVYARLFLRKLSFIITPIIARLPITPNMLTTCSIFIGIAGAIFLMLPGFEKYLAGVLLILTWYFLDAVDGDLARYKHMQSLKGVYIDTLGHYIVNPLIFSSFSFYLAIIFNEPIYLGVGFFTFLTHQYSRLAGDICHSVKYVQIDRMANPRQSLDFLPPQQQSSKGVQRILSVLGGPAAYIFDTISITIITGVLRLLIANHLIIQSVVIYLVLALSVLVGTSLIILSEIKKLTTEVINSNEK